MLDEDNFVFDNTTSAAHPFQIKRAVY